MTRLFYIGFLLFSTLAQSQSTESDLMDAFGKFESGSFHDAVAAFDKVLNGRTNDVQKIELYKGISEYKIHNYSDALQSLQLSDNRNYPETDLWIARTYAALADKYNTLLYIERYLQLDSDPNLDKISKDSVFRFLYNTNEWFDLWQKDWLSEKQNACKDAKYYMSKKDFNQAHLIIDNEILAKGSEPLLYSVSSQIYASEGNTELALNDINKALVADPENIDYIKQKAGYLIQLSKFSDAVIELNHILQIRPEDFDSRYKRAETALSAEDYQLAKTDIEMYLKYFSSENVLFLAGKIYYSSGEYIVALKLFNRLMDTKYPDVRYFRARGLTYLQTNTYDQAAKDLSMSLDLEPNNAESNFYLGLAEFSMGNSKSACYYWKRAKYFGDLKAEEYLQKYCHE
jgi:Tfp pilus assembly protein PilF